MIKGFSWLMLVFLFAGCGSTDPVVQEVELAVSMPKLQDREPAVDSAVRAVFTKLRETAHSGDPSAVGRGYGEVGMTLHANAFPKEAEACYREALARDSENYQWPYLMGYLFSQREAWEEAANWFEQCLKLEPRYSAAHVRVGRCYLNLDRLDDAKAEFEWILNVNPKSAAAMFGLGKIALERRDFATAVNFYEKALSSQPQATAVFYPLAMAYRRLNERERAETALARRGKEDTQFFDPIVAELEGLNATAEEAIRRGLAALNANQIERAAMLLGRAIKLAPEDATAHLNYGFAMLKKQNLDLAKNHFERAVTLKPDMVEGHTNLGVVEALKGNDGEAIVQFQKALAIDDSFEGARVLLANANMRLGQFDAALELHRRLMTDNPQNSRAFFYYGLTLVQLQREAEALSHFETSIARFPQQAELVEALARLLACSPKAVLRDGPRALQIAQNLFQSRQNMAHAQTLAMALAENGQYTEAVDLQRQILDKVDPQSNPRLREELQARLDQYRAQQPCRQPWRAGDPLLKPGPP